jgi:hypothetical protein
MLRFEIFTALAMKNAIWDVTLCRSWINRRFGATYCLHHQDREIRERENQRQQVAAD